MPGDHYAVLGVPRTAGESDIRAAYRREARRLHPDSAGEGSSAQMARLNEAYRVLSDPGRRALYDRALGGSERSSAAGDGGVYRPPPPPAHVPPMTPARFPWRFVLVIAVLGAAVVMVGALTSPPEAEGEIDGILRAGSCAVVDADSFAREVPCTLQAGELIVEALIPTDQDCPLTTRGHLDRLGLGRACLTPRP